MKTILRRVSLSLVPLLLLLAPVSLAAADFGLLLDQNFGVSGSAEDNAVDYSAALIPRFSGLIGNNAEFFVSAGMNVNYAGEEWDFVPELLRTDFVWRSGVLGLRAGRMNYSDPLGFIASGLFDGAQVSYDTAAGTFSAGAWYTGLLYKKTANITMTAGEESSYHGKVKYDDFFDTYFASKRMLGALGWEHPALAGFLRTKFAVLGQFDLNGSDIPFHSQYLTGKIGIPFKRFLFDLGGGFEIAEIDDMDLKFAYAGTAGISWFPPSSFQDQLALSGKFTSGGTDGSVIAFAPLTTETQGDLLKAKISGLSLVSLAYTARLHQTFSAALSASYFMRSDLVTYQGYPAAEDDGHLLGGELFARLIWSPVSDIQVKAGGGIFLPGMGDTAPDADPIWRIELGAVIALY